MNTTRFHKCTTLTWPRFGRVQIAATLLLGMALIATPAFAATVTEDDRFTSSDWVAFDNFGYAVAVSGTTVVVGAPGDSDAGTYSGSAYVFDCSTLPCTQVSKLIPSDGRTSGQFGTAVAVNGTLAVVGSPNVGPPGPNESSPYGAAYVFDLATCGSACTESQRLVSSDAAPVDYFGLALAMSGTTLAVSAPYDDHDGYSDIGSAYVFDCSGSLPSPCTQTSKLTASDGSFDDLLGTTLAISGSLVLVGAPDSYSARGKAYIFDITSCGTACTETDILIPPDNKFGVRFADSVSIDGTTVVIGTPGHVPGWPQDSFATGAAYAFDCSSLPSPCTLTNKLTASDVKPDNGVTTGEHFSETVAVNGTTAVVGASGWEDNNAFSDFGAAYVYDLSSCGEACTESSLLRGFTPADSRSLSRALAMSPTMTIAGASRPETDGDDAVYIFVKKPEEIFIDGFED